MRVALIYDWLNVKIGGGETTFVEISKLYPDADIFCLVYNENKFKNFFKNRSINTSRLQKFPKFIKKRPYLMLPFIKKAVNKLDFDGYDMVISVSSAWVKNISVDKSTTHICYCYSPARMIWDSWPEYLDTQKIGPFKLGPVSKFVVTRLVSKIRLWAFYNTDNVDGFVAISKHIKARIDKFYHRESELVYPPVIMGNKSLINSGDKEYFLVLSSLSQYKKIDVAINACLKTDSKLIIVGDGPDLERLQKIAKNNDNIKFVGSVHDDNKWKYYAGAKALLFTSIEDFGIAPVEAMSVGTPVIALQGGGLLETVVEGTSGIFYENDAGLIAKLKTFDNVVFSPEKIRLSVEKYDIANFKKNFVEKIDYLHSKGKYENQ